MNELIPTLLLIAAIALLPAWLVGSAALGAALALWCLGKLAPRRRNRASRQGLPANVVRFPRGRAL